MNHHTQRDPEDDLATIIGKYALGDLTLGQASTRANMSRWRMMETLQEAGVDLRLGPDDEDDLDREVRVALDAE